MAATTSSLSVRLQAALNQPQVATRCEEVARILSEATTKDAGYILRATVESILVQAPPTTIQGCIGWGLRVITRSAQPREFEQLRAFLGPNGPLLALIFRLASDPYMVFEFPVAWLPAKSRLEIEEGSPSAFYVNKVQYPGPGKVPFNILLNAFEYYLFHFAHFLVGGSSSSSSGSSSGMGQRWTLTWSTAGDALYPTLLEEYLTAFLPCDGSLPPGPPSPPVSPRGVLAARPGCAGSPNMYMSGLAASPITPRPLHHLGQSPHNISEALGGVGETMGAAPHTSSPLHVHHHSAAIAAATGAASPHGVNQPSLSVWTSQVLVQVLIEMWVNQCVPPSATSRTSAATRPSHHPHHLAASTSAASQYALVQVGVAGSVSAFSEHTPLEYRPFWQTGASEVFVPSSDHVRVVRMLIKHLHFFANSGKAAQPSPLDSLRKNLWNLYRKSLYQFFVHTFKHWPLDSSFRLLLETWLSYIQPWRYCDYPPCARSPTSTQSTTNTTDGESRTVEGRWQGFVAENLLFYSLLFHHLLLRLFRLDLSAPRNAQILFRVTKVFSQPNLCRYIQEIESALEDPHLIHRSLLSPTSTAPTLSHKGFGPGRVGGDARSQASLARSHCVEMEGPGHSYIPMFAAPNVSLVDSLMKHVRSAYEAVYSEQQQQQQQQLMQQQSTFYSSGVGPKTGWWSSFVRSLFESSVTLEEESSAEDVRKTIVHLEMGQRHLSAMFGISCPHEVNYGSGSGNHLARSHFDASSHHHLYHSQNQQLDSSCVPEHEETSEGPMLTAYGQHQLRCGLRRRDLKYEGDPDLRPIGSMEVAFLVRWLYALCLILNSKHGDKMMTVYHRQDLIGWVARHVLQGPETIFEYHKDSPDAPAFRKGRHLPPRLSLRAQASKRILSYELAMGLVLHLFGLWGLLLKLVIGAAVLISLPAYLVHRYLQTRHTSTTAITTSGPATATSLVNTMLSSPAL
ncbi:sphingomyelin phosphodiesterase 4-like isoform X2 [Portunus trituberculatus]|uniref:sphingomyelin phosphodiesterase 4-like isoform X2 n=1 Tax=Portunus trituberculatus TaxID=210409 RepID=UPI001E1CE430|nr:sphingomyelin phosphodiesterase 4-like isoform X2 [Portunus trituberculatus]